MVRADPSMVGGEAERAEEVDALRAKKFIDDEMVDRRPCDLLERAIGLASKLGSRSHFASDEPRFEVEKLHWIDSTPRAG